MFLIPSPVETCYAETVCFCQLWIYMYCDNEVLLQVIRNMRVPDQLALIVRTEEIYKEKHTELWQYRMNHKSLLRKTI